MDNLKFKTTIKCSGCIEKVTPFLDQAVGEKNWEVDTLDPAKILSITNKGISPEQVIKAVQDAGFKAEEVG